jgi:hypothetical protein
MAFSHITFEVCNLKEKTYRRVNNGSKGIWVNLRFFSVVGLPLCYDRSRQNHTEQNFNNSYTNWGCHYLPIIFQQGYWSFLRWLSQPSRLNKAIPGFNSRLPIREGDNSKGCSFKFNPPCTRVQHSPWYRCQTANLTLIIRHKRKLLKI